MPCVFTAVEWGVIAVLSVAAGAVLAAAGAPDWAYLAAGAAFVLAVRWYAAR